MVDAYNWEGYQIPHVGLSEVDVVTPGAVGSHQYRNFGMRMSNFGALTYGVTVASDYTRKGLGFKDKDELMNPAVPSFAQDGEWDPNPYVWGSTVKRIRDDEFTITGLGSRRDIEAGLPGFDVSDTDVADASGFESPKHYPTEGWRTFGKRTGGPFGWDPTL